MHKHVFFMDFQCFQRDSRVSVGLKRVSLKPYKNGFSWMEEENSWKIEGFYGEKGKKMKVSFGRRGKGKWCLQQYSGSGINMISKFWRGTTVKFWTEERHEAFKSLQEPTVFSNKIFSLKAQQVLATFCYKKYYRWLTSSSTKLKTFDISFEMKSWSPILLFPAFVSV